MKTINWKCYIFDDNGGTYPVSKLHFTDEEGKFTLCGRRIPTRQEAAIECPSDKDSVGCKSCQTARDKKTGHWRSWQSLA